MSTPWNVVAEHLIRAGLMTADGITRRAKAINCGCGAAILAGLDDDIAALPVRVDPKPLTPLAEALAVVVGRATATLRREARGYVLNYRDSYRIAGHPAGAGHYDVLAEHVCGTAPAWPGTTTAFAPPIALTEECPF